MSVLLQMSSSESNSSNLLTGWKDASLHTEQVFNTGASSAPFEKAS